MLIASISFSGIQAKFTHTSCYSSIVINLNLSDSYRSCTLLLRKTIIHVFVVFSLKILQIGNIKILIIREHLHLIPLNHNHSSSEGSSRGSLRQPMPNLLRRGWRMFVTRMERTWHEAQQTCGDSSDLLAEVLRAVYLHLHQESTLTDLLAPNK